MIDLAAYFARIGCSGPRAPTLETLRALHFHHPLAIAFENLDPLLGLSVPLDPAALEDKLVRRRRGGYCFEQNLLFAHVLRALGFEAASLVARVVWEGGDDGTRPRTHMLLLVQLGEGTYVADVGFGGLTMTAPLRLEPGVDQRTPHEVFHVAQRGNEFAIDVVLPGGRKTLYTFDLQQQRQIDIEVVNHFVSTHPSSPFLSSLIAARAAEGGRYALRDNRLSARRADGSAEQTMLSSPAALRGVLTETFGIDVPAGAAVDAALERVIR